MSMIILTKKVPFGTAEYITLPAVQKNQSSGEILADFIRRVAQEKKLGLRQIEEQSRRRGNKITHGYLSKLLSGQSSNPSKDKLEAIAYGLGIPIKEVYDAIGGDPYESSPEFARSHFASMAFKYEKMPKTSKKRVEIETLMKILDEKLDEAQGE
jgi:transcriptional regulator with XRE-family HTH domain